MKSMNSKTMVYSAISFITFLLLLGNFYLVRSVDVFGSPFLFAIGLLVELILIVVFVYSLVRALKTPFHIIGSILVSALKGILTNPYIKHIRKTKTPVSRWLVARLNRKNPFGLMLTAGVAISIVFFIGFSGVLQDVLFHDQLTRIDTRVINLMPSIRTPLQTSFFRFVTFTANSESILLLIVLSGAILWRKRQRAAIGIVLTTTIIVEGTAFILKNLVGRMRPEQYLSLYREDSFSFPSGHTLAATVLFGLLAYLLFRSFKSPLLRLATVIGYLVSVSLVALSRIYLGVHYPSDVFASILVGTSLLALIITGIEITVGYKLWGQSLKSFTNKTLSVVPILIILFSFVASPHFIQFKSVDPQINFTTVAAIDETTFKELPLYSETLTGKTMEPINFIYIGSRSQIEQLFLSHGWYKADPSTISNTLRALSVGLQDRQYQNAPVTPSYLNSKPQDLAFQRPTQSKTLRQRHHTRLWQTDFRLPDGKEIWVATASYDEGIEFAGPAKLPTHHIDPNIDAERSFIIDSLELKKASYLQVVQPQAGKNAGGDIFFTDGRAALIKL